MLSLSNMADDSSKNRSAYWRGYGGAPVKELIEAIAMGLVDKSDDVQVRVVEGKQVTVFELRVHPDDLGKVIGRKGRTAQSIRTLLGAMGMKERKRFVLDILE